MFAEFITENWTLFVAILLVLGLIAFENIKNPTRGSNIVDSVGLSQLSNSQQAVLLDIREKEAFIQGHIAGSRNIPVANLSTKINGLLKSKKRPLIIISESGTDVKGVQKTLKENEFDQIFVLGGGIAQWRRDALPLIKKS